MSSSDNAGFFLFEFDLFVFSDTRAGCDLPEEQPDDDDGEEYVKQGEGDEGYDEAGHGRDRLARAHDALNNPGLPPDLRDRPASFDGDHACGREQHKSTKKDRKS